MYCAGDLPMTSGAGKQVMWPEGVIKPGRGRRQVADRQAEQRCVRQPGSPGKTTTLGVIGYGPPGHPRRHSRRICYVYRTRHSVCTRQPIRSVEMAILVCVVVFDSRSKYFCST